MSNESITEEELQEAMKLLEEPQEIEEEEITEERSPILQSLDKGRQPKVKTACETCPNAMWFSSSEEVKCYCRIMHMISWGAKDASLITACDGRFME